MRVSQQESTTPLKSDARMPDFQSKKTRLKSAQVALKGVEAVHVATKPGTSHQDRRSRQNLINMLKPKSTGRITSTADTTTARRQVLHQTG